MRNEETDWTKSGHGFAQLLRSKQIQDSYKYAHSTTIAGLLNAVILSFMLWDSVPQLTLLNWLALLLVCAILRFREMSFYSDVELAPRMLNTAYRWVEIIALAHGILWGVGLAYFSIFSSPGELMILLFICAVMMGTAVSAYTAMFRSAVLFLMPLVLGAVMMLIFNMMQPLWLASAVLASYSATLLLGSYFRSRCFREQVEIDRGLRESDDTVRLLLSDFAGQSSSWLWATDMQGTIINPSERFVEAAAMTSEELCVLRLSDLADRSPEQAELTRCLSEGETFKELVIPITVTGKRQWWMLSAQPHPGGGMRGIAFDVTLQRRAEEQLQFMLNNDALTELPNRKFFTQSLNQALQSKDSGSDVVLFLMNIDGFKRINEQFGYRMGDKLLKSVAFRLSRVIHHQDLAARFASDEFAILMAGNDAPWRAARIGKTLLEHLGAPFQIDAEVISISVSIGMAQTSGETLTSSQILRRADLALQTARRAPVSQVESYTHSMEGGRGRLRDQTFAAGPAAH